MPILERKRLSVSKKKSSPRTFVRGLDGCLLCGWLTLHLHGSSDPVAFVDRSDEGDGFGAFAAIHGGGAVGLDGGHEVGELTAVAFKANGLGVGGPGGSGLGGDASNGAFTIPALAVKTMSGNPLF